VFFDVLALDGRDLRQVGFWERRKTLESAIGNTHPSIRLTPTTRDNEVARDWFRRFEGAGLDGIVAKALDDIYRPNKRVMLPEGKKKVTARSHGGRLAGARFW
jgi:ATP-dependent DNA ligase